MEIDLRRYVVARVGDWTKNEEEFFRADRLELRKASDGVTLAGPLRAHVAIVALNELDVYGTSAAVMSVRDAFSYVLELAPGQTWTYGSRSGSGNDLMSTRSLAMAPLAALGTNAGFGIVVRPAGPSVCATDPCAPEAYRAPDPCAPRGKSSCGCQKSPCACGGERDALPCDFAVASHPDLGFYFPASCEPCAPGASIGTLPAYGSALVVPPAPGGTVRTRYFDGMAIAKEDFETDWKNARLKRALSNRALGQGVVWGFRVARDGSGVCITPGYGLDCCGNDVILAAPYRVESDLLVRDPAARALVHKRGPQRMHLLLEYFECPERPRPVHADACGRDAARCEMSRIRETARLRLVPPCDVEDDGPIKRFLAELTELRKDPHMREVTAEVESGGTRADRVPFQVGFELLDQNGKPYEPPETAELQPAVGANRQRADLFPQQQHSNVPYGRVRVRLRPKSGFTFSAATVVRVQRVDANGDTVADDTTISVSSDGAELFWLEPVGTVFNLPERAPEPIPAGSVFELRNWLLRDAQGKEFFAARTELHLTHLHLQTWTSTPWGTDHLPNSEFLNTVLHLQVLPSDVRMRSISQAPRRFPCISEACDPTGAPRFPAMFPFLHPDPLHRDGLGDVRAIFLAILYAWLVSEQAYADAGASDTQREQAVRAIYVAVWRSFYGTVPDSDRKDLSESLQRLFEAWCCALLYPGPTCRCEPHGVIVGCAVVEGGVIRSVDSWGGRRWVVLHPLLAHWGSQFGLMPLDAVASKLFDMLCCIAHLPRPNTTQREPQGLPNNSPHMPTLGLSADVPLAGGALIFGDAGKATKRMLELKMVPSATVTLNPLDFVARVVAALKAPGAQPPDRARKPVFTHYRALGVEEIHFVALEATAAERSDG
jgi:hypothetical protein